MEETRTQGRHPASGQAAHSVHLGWRKPQENKAKAGGGGGLCSCCTGSFISPRAFKGVLCVWGAGAGIGQTVLVPPPTEAF